jgi:aminopeptidase YwaD
MTAEFKPEISGEDLEAAFRAICAIGPRWQGTQGEKDILAFLERYLTHELSVEVIKDRFQYLGYRVKSAELKTGEKPEVEIACQGLAYSASKEVEGELVYVPEEGLDRKDFSGKVVLTDAVRSYLAYPKVVEGNALGLVLGNNLPENLVRVGITNYSGRIGDLPALAIGSLDTQRLLRLLAEEDLHVRLGVKANAEQAEGTNFVVRTQGSPGKGKILVISHYDSMWLGPHANDNASGVATLLALIRCFKESPYNLEFLFCGAEELGFWGSKSYAEKHTETCRDLIAVTCTDGISSDLGPQEIGVSEEIAPDIRRLAQAFSFQVDRWSIPPRPGSDHASFIPFKRPTFWLTANAPYYHTAADVPEHVSGEKLIRNSEFMAAVIMKLAA